MVKLFCLLPLSSHQNQTTGLSFGGGPSQTTQMGRVSLWTESAVPRRLESISFIYYVAKHFLIIQSDVGKRLQVLGDIFHNALRP